MFTGRQGLPLKLADLIGGESDAIAWLETNKNVAKKLPVRDWKKKPSIERVGLLGLASSGVRAAGFIKLASFIDQFGGQSESASLDGLLAIWQGSGAN